MAAIQHILAANQQQSQMVYINAYVRQHFSPLNVLSDRADNLLMTKQPDIVVVDKLQT